MSELLTAFIEEKLPKIEQHMYDLVRQLKGPERLKESMLYSLEAGGKRIRPLYVIAVEEMYGKSSVAGYTTAAALEMIHTYSLIHDDLPCMDNDDMRRGKPTNHIQFDEATAVLAGDALNSLAFGVITRVPDADAKTKLQLVDLLSERAGAEGMVGGQILDMEGEKRTLNLQELEQVHVNKTGALLRYGIEAGAILGGASESERQALATYGHHIGLAFQIQDDILDIVATSDELGKTAGKDEKSDKSTYPALLTLEGAREKLQQHYDAAIEALATISVDTTILQQFATYIVKRNH